MTDEELRDYSVKHLDYELWMLQETARRLLHDLNVHHDRVGKNAMVESCCVHARALTAFLYPEDFSRREGDVTANDYVTDVRRWTDARGGIPDILIVVKERTGKEIALAQIVDALLATLKLFVRHAAPERLAPFVEGHVTGLQSPMAQSTIVIYEVGSTGIMRAWGPSTATTSTTMIPPTPRLGESG